MRKAKAASTVKQAQVVGFSGSDVVKNDIVAMFEKLKQKDQLEVLKRLNVGVSEYSKKQSFATCARCGVVKRVDDFYVSTETGVASHITPICKDCAKDIALERDINGNIMGHTKANMINAMEWLRKPFLENIYNTSVASAADGSKSVFDYYITAIQKPGFVGQTFRANSDFYNVNKPVVLEEPEEILMAPVTEDAAKQFEKNKMDCQRLLGYLPFESEEPADQPYLYADLVGFLGSVENASENYMRVRTMIGIVRWFLQLEKIDNTIARLSSSPAQMDANMASIKGLQDTKSKITDTITKMADDSRISLKSNHDNIKGANTFTGKLSKLKDLNLRASYVNGFDLATCKAMQQVADVSSAAILKQLNLDESEWSDMVAEQRKMITELTKKAQGYQEAARIILKENQDLRQTLTDNGLLNKENLVNLSDIVNTYWIEGGKHADDSQS